MTIGVSVGVGREIVLLDGPTGTELHRRGVPTPLPGWSALALRTHPDVVLAIHEDYIAAGADIITTNTFRTNSRAVRAADLGDASSLTREAVGIARQAVRRAGRKVLVAGSVAPLEDCYRPDLVPGEATVLREHRELIEWLLDAGVDLIKIETMNTLREARTAVRAARSLTDKPILAAVVCGPGAKLLSGEEVDISALDLMANGADAVLVNCSSVNDTTEALRRMAATATYPFGAYANSGAPDPIAGWNGDAMVSVDVYADAVRTWRSLGARIFGGCCGTRPEHIATLRATLV